jgi:2-dehydropantoate 2-reductase
LGRFIAGGRGSKLPSLMYDLQPQPRGHSEVAWLNGAVAEQARALGLPAPVNATLTRVLLDLVEGRATVDEWRGQPQRLLAAVAQAPSLA